MLGRVWKIFTLCSTILYISLPLFNQYYDIHNYTIKNGLPSGVIYDLTQSSSGEMWFASNVGVLEFDNLTWKIHKIKNDKTNLDAVLSIKWMASDKKKVYAFYDSIKSGGYSYYNKKWYRINGPSEEDSTTPITGISLATINKRTIMGIGTYKRGLYLYDFKKWRHITKKDGLLDDDIISIDAHKGKFYIVTKRGISIFSKENIDNSINKFLPDRGRGITGIRVVNINGIRTIWLAGSNWIGRFRKGKFKKALNLNFQISRKYGKYLSFRKTIIEYDRRGRVFFGNVTVLYFLDLQNGKIKKLDSYNGTTTSGITAMLQDRELNIWTGTRRGISKIASLQFENYSCKNGLLEDEVTAIAELSPDKIIFGHNNGLTIFTHNTFKKISLGSLLGNKKLYNSRVFDIFVDKKRVWVAAGTAGLFLFDSQGDFNLLRHWGGGSNKKYISVRADKKGNIWIGGSSMWKLKKRKLLPIKNKILPRFSTRKIYVSENNAIYFASSTHGVFILKDNKWKRYYSNNNSLYNSTYVVSSYKAKRILVGSAGGLLEVKNGQLTLFSEFKWRINLPVYFITKDKKNNYWVGTNRGIVKFNDNSYRYFTYIDGLVGIEANRGGCLIDSFGDVWIGMDQGVSKYTPDMIEMPSVKPLLRITKARTNSLYHSLSDKVQSQGKTTLEFFFKGISFIDINPLQYKYKLEGYDNEWNSNNFRNGYVRYDNVPVGKYSFAVKAINGRRIESQVCTINNIKIFPPFYLTYWFLLLLITLILISTLLFNRYFKQVKISKLLKREIFNKNIQLKESLLNYQSLFEESLDCIFTSTPEGKFLSINKAGLDMLGYKSLKKLSEKNIQREIYVDENLRNELKKQMKEKGFVKNFESTLRKKDGTELIVLESSYLIKNDKGDIIGYRGIIRDITKQHQLQTQLVQAQKMESIGLLAGGIAHDFNNVLSGILGYANLLKRFLIKDKKLYKYVSTIERSAERASELTSKLLGFARKGKYNVALIDMNQIIMEVISLLHPLIDKSITIKSNLVKSKWLVEADSTQVQQVIMNICLNARDALPNGGIINISSKYVKLSDEDQHLFALVSNSRMFFNISIEDNGFGIKEEYIAKIFDPFFTTKKGSKGYGLGLSMVYGVLKNHNGALNVTSIDGEKTIFDLYFPVNKKHKDNLKSGKSIDSDTIEMLNKLQGHGTVLIIDDEKIHRDLLVTVLRDSGYKTLQASDGVKGIKLFSSIKKKVNLVILDMSMPKMSGDKVFLELKKISPNVKVLVNSGYSLDEKIRSILKYSGTDFIQKPFKPSALLIKVKTMIEEVLNKD